MLAINFFVLITFFLPIIHSYSHFEQENWQEAQKNSYTISYIDPYQIRAYKQASKVRYVLLLDSQYIKNVKYQKLPRAVTFVQQNPQIKITFKKVSHDFFALEQLSTQNNQNQNKLIKNVTIFSVNINNYLFQKANSQSSVIPNSILIAQDSFKEEAKNMFWDMDSNGITHRLAIIYNQSICFSSDDKKLQAEQQNSKYDCFAIKIRDYGQTHPHFGGDLHFKVFKKPLGIQELKFFQVHHMYKNKFSLYFGNQKIIYMLKTDQMRLDFQNIIKNQENVFFNDFFVMDGNITMSILSNNKIEMKKGLEKNESTPFCNKSIEGIQSCKQISSKYVQCQTQNSSIILSNNCQIKFQGKLKRQAIYYKRIQQQPQITEKLELVEEKAQILDLTTQITSNESSSKSIVITTYQKNQYNAIKQYQFNEKSLQNITQYQTQYSDRIMESILADNMQYEQLDILSQKSQCNVANTDQNDNDGPKRIIFNEGQSWKLCRFSLQISTTYIMKPQNSEVTENPNFKSYRIIYCQMSVNSTRQKCFFHSNNETDQILHRNKFYRIYLLNQGNQNYNISLLNIEKLQMMRVTNAFFIILGIMVIIICAIFIIALLKSTFVMGLIYFNYISDQPNYRYPLSFMALKIRMKRLSEKGFLKYKKKAIQNTNITENPEQICCFCLQTITCKDSLVQLYCRHQYHAKCFEHWIRNQPFSKCPFCKRGFTSQQLQRFKAEDSYFKIKDNLVSTQF